MWLWLTQKAGRRVLVNMARVNEVYPLEEGGSDLFLGVVVDNDEQFTRVLDTPEEIAAALANAGEQVG